MAVRSPARRRARARSAFEMPKSSTFTSGRAVRARVRNRFAGLRSRCTMPSGVGLGHGLASPGAGTRRPRSTGSGPRSRQHLMRDRCRQVLHDDVGSAVVEAPDVHDADHVLALQEGRRRAPRAGTGSTAASSFAASRAEELDGDRLFELERGGPRRRCPCPPTPSTRSTTNLPPTISPGWGTPAVALDASPPPDASDPIGTPYRVAPPPSTIFPFTRKRETWPRRGECL